MRWLDFRALRDLLLLVGKHADGLRANELTQLANDEGVLLRRDGRSYANSMHYHHRRTLERLDLLNKRNRHFVLNRDNPGIATLTVDSRFRKQLTPVEKIAFANAVIRNKDCHDVFLAHFLPAREPVYDVAGFIEHGQRVQVAVKSGKRDRSEPDNTSGSSSVGTDPKSVAIRCADGTDWSTAYGADAIQAIHFGLKSWCADQLGFMDIAYRADGTYVAYPKHIDAQLTDHELAAAMFNDLDFKENWATIRVPDCTLNTGAKYRVSIEQTKNVLMEWLTDHPELVAGVASRVGFITAGLTERQATLALKSYLRSNSGAYLSHVRVHQMLKHYMR